jgi:predicted metalloprotease with PDZ domain
VKRIRPQSLEPIDYTKENYTRALWFSEGVTSTAEDIILLRAGLIDERTYLQRIGDRISEIEERPAHLAQSAEESSLDAWLEGNPYYRRPERSISYYTKGQLLGVVLDLAVRDGSRNRACLRDVLQWMNQNFAKQQKFFPDSSGVRQAAEAVSHSDLSGFFQKYVSGVEEIPWDDFFKVVGLHLVRTTETVADFGFSDVQNFDAPPSVVRVEPKSDAEKAGLAVGDVLLEINGKPATSHSDDTMGDMHPGDTLHLRVRNRRGEREVSWKLGSREEVDFQVRDLANVTPEQKAARATWLKGEAQPAGESRP